MSAGPLIDLAGLGIVQPWAQSAVALGALLAVAFIANWVAKRIVLNLIQRGLALSPLAAGSVQLGRIVRRLSNAVPALIIQLGIGVVPHLPPQIPLLVANVCAAFIILTVAIAISGALGLANDLYQARPEAASRPIKGYVQVGKLLVYAAAAVLAIAALMDRSPLLLLSGLGALAAVLMLVFKDTILSLVASVQINSNDMVRVGDWIEMPQLDADGDVIDVALHTVKVQNWDKTITTIPTHRLISESFRNWRGMAESGGRRIKRALMIDQSSVRFLDPDEVARLRRFALIETYLDDKLAEIEAWNSARPERVRDAVNARRLTNIGTFRAYVLAYLEDRADISRDMTLMVRQLAPTAAGLPLEIYAFTTTTAWTDYERIQGDIFDHLLAILPAFGLRLFQNPSGMDLAALAPQREPADPGRRRAA
ncbi:mechanosensitive ion channel family protein [Sphingosinicella sp. CPCC 101087]|uniref:mechanosensitive ion channel family protein n=1 Tax=Sphingosinicella sp. CPCC 101087 TaxID=2497754 RepID=UPI001FB1A06B|nr:mechanosensitive ion channel domain-containing protein [Sphingosinicella sp. CPCC 101087]